MKSLQADLVLLHGAIHPLTHSLSFFSLVVHSLVHLLTVTNSHSCLLTHSCTCSFTQRLNGQPSVFLCIWHAMKYKSLTPTPTLEFEWLKQTSCTCVCTYTYRSGRRRLGHTCMLMKERNTKERTLPGAFVNKWIIKNERLESMRMKLSFMSSGKAPQRADIYIKS